ncbi:hypothetical protein EJ06DRAFT_401115 [Trichodelitschia bisporula]|uniref:Uncharacterized protein n=1 Tax=Trichodelitschia bisporula TaxID=703511 RepID=A0A6G1HXR3_9PEZI|nr:hypothetical protein EJ06DRAFT_401115 [Trichodelitschia bisporula]
MQLMPCCNVSLKSRQNFTHQSTDVDITTTSKTPQNSDSTHLSTAINLPSASTFLQTSGRRHSRRACASCQAKSHPRQPHAVSPSAEPPAQTRAPPMRVTAASQLHAAHLPPANLKRGGRDWYQGYVWGGSRRGRSCGECVVWHTSGGPVAGGD